VICKSQICDHCICAIITSGLIFVNCLDLFLYYSERACACVLFSWICFKMKCMKWDIKSHLVSVTHSGMICGELSRLYVHTKDRCWEVVMLLRTGCVLSLCVLFIAFMILLFTLLLFWDQSILFLYLVYFLCAFWLFQVWFSVQEHRASVRWSPDVDTKSHYFGCVIMIK